jgi:hypothetical protein
LAAHFGLATKIAHCRSTPLASGCPHLATLVNSGVNEGRITDLKLQKRITAGRTVVQLLRPRVILKALLRRRHP